MSCHYFDWDICFYLYKMVTRYAARIIFGAPALREKIFFSTRSTWTETKLLSYFCLNVPTNQKGARVSWKKKFCAGIRESDMRRGCGEKTISFLLLILSGYLFAVCLHFSGGSPVPRRHHHHHHHLKFGQGRGKNEREQPSRRGSGGDGKNFNLAEPTKLGGS